MDLLRLGGEMASVRYPTHWVCRLGLVLLGLALLLETGSAEARRKRRQRRVDECAAPPTITQPEQDKAMRFYDSAVIYWESKDWDRARSDFQNAYNITRLPDFLINLALVAEKQRKFNDAVRFLDDYIEACPRASDLDKVEQKKAEMKISQAIEAGERPAGTVKGSLPPIPAIALMATGAALLITGVGLGSAALATSQQVGSPENRGTPWSAALQAKEVAGQRMATTSYVFDSI